MEAQGDEVYTKYQRVTNTWAANNDDQEVDW